MLGVCWLVFTARKTTELSSADCILLFAPRLMCNVISVDIWIIIYISLSLFVYLFTDFYVSLSLSLSLSVSSSVNL